MLKYIVVLLCFGFPVIMWVKLWDLLVNFNWVQWVFLWYCTFMGILGGVVTLYLCFPKRHK